MGKRYLKVAAEVKINNRIGPTRI